MRILFLIFLSLFTFAIGYSQEKFDSIKYTADNNWNLILASYYNDSAKIFHWLNEGADINYETNDGITALMYAVENGYDHIVKYLIENGVNIIGEDQYGRNVFWIASFKNNYKVLKELSRKELYSKQSWSTKRMSRGG